jgi:hypothetical protein
MMVKNIINLDRYKTKYAAAIFIQCTRNVFSPLQYEENGYHHILNRNLYGIQTAQN